MEKTFEYRYRPVYIFTDISLAGAVSMFTSFLLLILYYMKLFFRKGNIGENIYGPVPVFKSFFHAFFNMK